MNAVAKIATAFNYALKIATIVSSLMLLFTFFAAPVLTKMFTWSKEGSVITNDLIMFLRIVFWGLPPLAIAMVVGAFFTGVGKSINGLILEIFRIVFLTIPLIILLSVSFNYGLSGIWGGMVLANLISAIFAFVWVKSSFSGKDEVIINPLKTSN